MASELRVDRIIPTTGVPTGGGGGIIQVVQSQITSQDEVTTATTWTDTTLTASITPKFSSSKILVSCHFLSTIGDNAQDLHAHFRIDRGGNTICSARHRTYDYGTSGVYSVIPVSMMFLDSPSTTSAVQYKLQFYLAAGDRVRISENGGNSSLILMEVSG